MHAMHGMVQQNDSEILTLKNKFIFMVLLKKTIKHIQQLKITYVKIKSICLEDVYLNKLI